MKLLAEDAFSYDTLCLLHVLLEYEELAGSTQFRDYIVPFKVVSHVDAILERYYDEWHNGVDGTSPCHRRECCPLWC